MRLIYFRELLLKTNKNYGQSDSTNSDNYFRMPFLS